ncbi:DUF5060 domain-containing protein [candidate division KSB1 bacterium]|nr:DUF5060 domain-containing protein [candidate division KSB1 bacterium]
MFLRKFLLMVSLVAFILACNPFSIIVGDGDNLNRITRLYDPFEEWELTNESWNGNPYDLVATVTFIHSSGKSHQTELFYKGDNIWSFRFTATEPGRWRFETSSVDPDLNGKSGEIIAETNPAPQLYGFLTTYTIDSQTRWVIPRGNDQTEQAFVPQLVMYTTPDEFYNNPAKIDNDLDLFIEEHGFTGVHVFSVAHGWTDISESGNGGNSGSDPDPRTFEALEDLILRVHRRGGLVHFWIWGDQQRNMVPPEGINSSADRRLQRYIAARLGPLPNWSAGYGFDLDEWVTAAQIKSWYDYMQDHLGWPHFLSARPAGPNSGTDHSSYIAWNQNLNCASYEHHKPTVEVYKNALQAASGRPVISEDRFRVRNRPKDYTLEETRRGLWHSMMAGGVANIWGNLTGDHSSRLGSLPYPNKTELKTWSIFAKTWFDKEMLPQQNGDALILQTPDRKKMIYYREDTQQIQIDCSGLSGSLGAIAVDAKRPYDEIAVPVTAGIQTWTAPYTSDWAVRVENH